MVEKKLSWSSRRRRRMERRQTAEQTADSKQWMDPLVNE